DGSRHGTVPGRLAETPATAGGRGIHLMDTTMERSALEAKLLPELQQIAQTLGVEGTQKLRKAGLIDAIVSASANGERTPANNGEEAGGSVAETATSSDDAPRELVGDTDERRDDRDRGESRRNDRGGRPGGQGGQRPAGPASVDGGGERDRRRRPSREERRRTRDERRVRDEQDRVEEL